MKKVFKKLMLTFFLVGVAVFLFVCIINLHVKGVAKDFIISSEKASQFDDVDAILVLGCKVYDDTPSSMLQDRLDRSIELYNMGVSPKLLMSGDHGQKEYDEVSVMKNYAIEAGVPSSDVFMDHAGFSTYESMFRAKEIFGADKVIIVTQNYHLYRAIYIARKLGIDAYGVSSDYHEYYGQTLRDAREIVARVKDFFTSLLKPDPTYLGDKISLEESGDIAEKSRTIDGLR